MNCVSDPHITRVQTFCRTALSKKKAEEVKSHLLPFALFKEATPYIDYRHYQYYYTANAGKTTVYLLERPFVVLKQSDTKCDKRLECMKRAQKVVRRLALSLLTVPRARIYKRFLIEERIPSPPYSLKTAMEFYYTHREEFTPAILQFARFVCETSYPYITYGETPRFDNIILYFDQEVPKIALVDLERLPLFGPKNSPPRLTELLTLFPYHRQQLIAFIVSQSPNLTIKKSHDLKIPKAYKLIERHLNYLKDKQITLNKVHEFHLPENEKLTSFLTEIAKYMKSWPKQYQEKFLTEELITIFKTILIKEVERHVSSIPREERNPSSLLQKRVISFRLDLPSEIYCLLPPFTVWREHNKLNPSEDLESFYTVHIKNFPSHAFSYFLCMLISQEAICTWDTKLNDTYELSI